MLSLKMMHTIIPPVFCRLTLTVVATILSYSMGTTADAQVVSDRTVVAESTPSIARKSTSDVSAVKREGRALLKSSGAFAKLWNRRFFVGPGILYHDNANDDSLSEYCLPGDFEAHEAIVVVGGQLARQFPAILTTIIVHSGEKLKPALIVSSKEEEYLVLTLLRQHGLSAECVRFIEAPTNTIWVRDFGPVFVRALDGSLGVFDPDYGKAPRRMDDSVPSAVAAAFSTPIIETPLIWQGGNLLSNGRGLLLTTTQSINANIEVGADADESVQFLMQRLGAQQIVVLEHLHGESTGHVDMFACFTSPETVLMGTYAKSVDPINAGVLDRNAARLAKVRVGGEKVKVIRIPMPANGDGIFRTFTNVIFLNDTVLVPTFPGVDPAAHRRALGILHRALPGWNVVRVDAGGLIRGQGGLRCISTYVPRQTETIRRTDQGT